jgi:Na+/proline symporter
VFLGGFSAATSMVIVAALALSTMVSNHIIVPLWLRATRHEDPMSGDMRRVALMARRLSIGGILFLGLGYYRLSGGADALAEIGLIAFLGVAQVLPALLGGILWRGATRVGAAHRHRGGLRDLGVAFADPQHRGDRRADAARSWMPGPSASRGSAPRRRWGCRRPIRC